MKIIYIYNVFYIYINVMLCYVIMCLNKEGHSLNQTSSL